MGQLDRITDRYELPADTRQRVVKSVRHLESFPQAGSKLTGTWSEFRFVLGPWPWMLIVYALVDPDRVAIVSIEDSRAANAVTNEPRTT